MRNIIWALEKPINSRYEWSKEMYSKRQNTVGDVFQFPPVLVGLPRIIQKVTKVVVYNMKGTKLSEIQIT